MDSAHSRSGPAGWIRTLGAIGAIFFPLAVLYSFITGDDGGDTSAEVVAYAEDHSADLWFMQIVALLVPLLIGCHRLPSASRLAVESARPVPPVPPGA